MNVRAMLRRLYGTEYTVTRYGAGAYSEVDGVYVHGAVTTVEILGSLQPLSPREIDMYTDGDRSKQFFKFFTVEDMVTIFGTNLQKADKVDVGGQSFRVISVAKWPTHSRTVLASETSEGS